jgi:hypothetical protein
MGEMKPLFALTVQIDGGSTSETSVDFKETTRRCIPENWHLHTFSRENLKSDTAEIIHVEEDKTYLG